MLDGEVHPDYADVASALIRQIPRKHQGGAAVCVYHRGECVADLVGGEFPDQATETRQLASLYARVMYARERLPAECLGPVRKLWGQWHSGAARSGYAAAQR